MGKVKRDETGVKKVEYVVSGGFVFLGVFVKVSRVEYSEKGIKRRINGDIFLI